MVSRESNRGRIAPPVEGREVVIIGDGEFAQIAYEYLTYDSPHQVVAFSAEEAFIANPSLYGLPVVPFESLEASYPPERFGVLVAITYTHLNRVRRRLLSAARAKGYRAISYVSSRAFVWHNVEVGENCFVFEDNVIQHHVRLEDGVVLWSGNHIGHRSTIRQNAYLSSHVVVSGYCDVGAQSFLGVNCSLADNIRVGDDCIVGAGTVVIRDLEAGGVYVGNPARATGGSSLDSFGVPPADR